ncbi:PilZ domain-containing protein [Sphingomonas sp. RS2018]
MKQREPRRTIKITARMKTASGWQDVAIENVSAHGMKISVTCPPQRGAYIEIRRASQIVVARTVWVDGNDCGLRTQDVIDIPALVNAHAIRAEEVIAAHAADHRKGPRAASVAARSTRFARHFQWMAVAAAGTAAAGVLAVIAAETLRRPFTAIETALVGDTGGGK